MTSTPQAPAIEIRRYRSAAGYQADAMAMAAAGWIPIAQMEARGGTNASWVGVAIILLVIAVTFGSILFFIGAIVVGGIAAAAPHKELVVTYRPNVVIGAGGDGLLQSPSNGGL
jgi:hypothetical protein